MNVFEKWLAGSQKDGGEPEIGLDDAQLDNARFDGDDTVPRHISIEAAEMRRKEEAALSADLKTIEDELDERLGTIEKK